MLRKLQTPNSKHQAPGGTKCAAGGIVFEANGWSAVAGTRSTTNNSISVAIPATGNRKFFRLSLK